MTRTKCRNILEEYLILKILSKHPDISRYEMSKFFAKFGISRHYQYFYALIDKMNKDGMFFVKVNVYRLSEKGMVEIQTLNNRIRLLLMGE